MTWDPDDKWSPEDVRDLIMDLRGTPTKCDFCENSFSPDDLIPEEAGQWSCKGCWDAFYHPKEEENDRGEPAPPS
jgi:hypothetical protein